MQKPTLNIQWHITARCDQNCKHCYMHAEDSYQSELMGELSTRECKKVIDDLARTARYLKAAPHIYFTGGDPLLRDDFFELLSFARQKQVNCSILGNPFHVDLPTAQRLKKLGLLRYQISIDGMERMHDFFRKKGSYKKSWEALRTLKGAGIKTIIMFTLSKKNEKDLMSVIRKSSKEGVDVFAFDRIVPMGNAQEFSEDVLSADELKAVMKKALIEFKRLEKAGSKTKFSRKLHLFHLISYEEGTLELPPEDGLIYEGCSAGITSLSILADGTVYPCRKLPIKIGKVPLQSIKDIFLDSKVLNRLRQISNFRKCRGCELVQVCRGCPAMSYAVRKDCFAGDPQCWKCDDESI